MLRGVLLTGALRLSELQSLVGERPVLVELDPRVDPSLYPTLVPRGFYYEVLAADASGNDRREGAEEQELRWTRLLQRAPTLRDAESRAQVFWRRYQDAIFYASLGDRGFARDAVDDALAINDQDEHLRALAAALQTPNDEGELEGPIDTRPYQVGP